MKTINEIALEASIQASKLSEDSTDREMRFIDIFAEMLLEEAAVTCDELAEVNRKAFTDSMWQQGECAAHIRAMKPKKG